MPVAQRILLAGGGHSHVEVLRRFALAPDPAVALTLVSPEADTAYSGMLPGLVAGHYTHRDAHIALAPLAARARCRLVVDRVEALDLAARSAHLASGARAPFDLVSLDVGSAPDTSAPGVRDLALAVKPVAHFLRAWDALADAADAGLVRTIAVVGGGAGGVELLLAMQVRLAARCGERAPRFVLCTDRPALLADHPPVVGARFARILAERGVTLHLATGIEAVMPGELVASGGRRIPADRVVWVTGAAAPGWLAGSGLSCDARGFVRVDAYLRSASHPFVFAAGDSATQVGHPRPKSGVFAVRQGPPLAANLRLAAHGRRMRAFVPQREALALISTGDRHALAVRSPFAAEGDWIWRWKDRIDRRFVAKYVLASAPTSPAPPDT